MWDTWKESENPAELTWPQSGRPLLQVLDRPSGGLRTLDGEHGGAIASDGRIASSRVTDAGPIDLENTQWRTEIVVRDGVDDDPEVWFGSESGRNFHYAFGIISSRSPPATVKEGY